MLSAITHSQLMMMMHLLQRFPLLLNHFYPLLLLERFIYEHIDTGYESKGAVILILVTNEKYAVREQDGKVR